MLKKTVITFAFLTILTTFYGFNARFGSISVTEGMTRDEIADEFMLLPEGDYLISAYDDLFRSVSKEEGTDWRLMSAIAYHESRFTPDLTSRQGARGMMQIMPSVARQFDVPVEQIANPVTNVRLASKLFRKINASVQLPATTSERDRTCIILACYVCGVGHVADARRLAKYHGENPNSWSVVARYLDLKSDPAYYQNDVVRYGRFQGVRQTRAYVNDVMQRYAKYCRVAGK